MCVNSVFKSFPLKKKSHSVVFKAPIKRASLLSLTIFPSVPLLSPPAPVQMVLVWPWTAKTLTSGNTHMHTQRTAWPVFLCTRPSCSYKTSQSVSRCWSQVVKRAINTRGVEVSAHQQRSLFVLFLWEDRITSLNHWYVKVRSRLGLQVFWP